MCVDEVLLSQGCSSGTTIHLKYIVRALCYFILSSIKHAVGTLQDNCISSEL